MKDPYKTLGVSKTATKAEIKAAYRKLAKELHPDRNDNPQLAEKFKEVSTAYNVLNDPAERQRYDQMQQAGAGFGRQGASGFGGFGGADFNQFNQYGSQGNPQFTSHRRAYNSPDWSAFFNNNRQQSGVFFSVDQGNPGGLGAMLQQLFGGQVARPSKNYQAKIRISFLEAALGTKKQLRLPNRKILNVNIPAGSENGQKLTLPGLGEQGAKSGNLHLVLEVAPHKIFRKQGKDIYLKLERSSLIRDRDGKIAIPSLRGIVKISAELQPGKTVRLPGLGIQTANQKPGDQYLELI